MARLECHLMCSLRSTAASAPALQDGQLKAAFAKFGIAPRGTTVQEGIAFTKSEYEKWRKVILDAHITLD